MRRFLLGLSLLAVAVPAAHAQMSTSPAPGGVAQPEQVAPGNYRVFFAFDSARLTSEARNIVAEAARSYRSTGMARVSVSGYADITVPAGYIEGLPIGVTFIAGRWSEPELIGLAFDFEQATEVRVPPSFIPTIGDDLFPGVPNPQEQAQRQQATQGQRDLFVRFR